MYGFRIGDVVKLKAGSDPMVVTNIREEGDGTGGDGNGLLCQWMDYDVPSQLQSAWLSESAVVPVATVRPLDTPSLTVPPLSVSPEASREQLRRPSETDVQAKNEYIDDRLHKAAEIVWLWYDACYGISEVHAPEQHFERALPRLRAILQNPDSWYSDPDPDVPFAVYWRALEIVELTRSLNTMSAAKERTGSRG